VVVLAVAGFPGVPLNFKRQLIIAATGLTVGDGSAARLMSVYLQSLLAAHLAEQAIVPGSADHEVLGQILVTVRDRVLNQEQVPHVAFDRPALLHGFGYCDQINAVVATVASHHFGKAQLVALYDAEEKITPHTIGRVWSTPRDTWLYFDAHYEGAVVFTKDVAGSPVHVPTRSEPALGRGIPPRDFYRMPGWVMNEYRSGFVSYLAVKGANAAGWGSIEAQPPLRPVPQPPPPTSPLDDGVHDRILAAYLEARVDHVLGLGNPKEAFRNIATDPEISRDWRATLLGRASEQFAATQ
jgi:hypothetical protein